MLKQVCSYVALLGVLCVSGHVMASGIPVYSYAEMVSQKVDEIKSDVGSKMVETQKKLVDSALNAVGGPETFSAEALKKQLAGTGKKLPALLEPSEVVTGHYEGLQNLLGAASEYGQIKIKKCGGNANEVIQRLNETIVHPAREADRLKMTTAQLDKIATERLTSLKRSATTGLAKAWVAQSDTSDIAETISKTQTELENADSQMDVFASLVRLQEETQKNLNSRFSLVADDVITQGLSVLDGNM